jgi:hypothetical protein
MPESRATNLDKCRIPIFGEGTDTRFWEAPCKHKELS